MAMPLRKSSKYRDEAAAFELHLSKVGALVSGNTIFSADTPFRVQKLFEHDCSKTVRARMYGIRYSRQSLRLAGDRGRKREAQLWSGQA